MGALMARSEYHALYYAKNRELIKARSAAYRAAHKVVKPKKISLGKPDMPIGDNHA